MSAGTAELRAAVKDRLHYTLTAYNVLLGHGQTVLDKRIALLTSQALCEHLDSYYSKPFYECPVCRARVRGKP